MHERDPISYYFKYKLIKFNIMIQNLSPPRSPENKAKKLNIFLGSSKCDLISLQDNL